MVDSDPDFTAAAEDEFDFETLQIAPPPSPVRILFRLMTETARVDQAIEALANPGTSLPDAAVTALICAIAEIPYPGEDYETEYTAAKQRLYVVPDDRRSPPAVNGKVAQKYASRAVAILRLARQALSSAEESAKYLYAANQIIMPRSMDNLTTLDLARRITEQATVYFRSRIG